MSQHNCESGSYLNRRGFLAINASVPVLAGASLIHVSAQEPRAAADKSDPGTKWGIPGPYPGRVIEVRNPRMIKNDVKNREAIHAGYCTGHEWS